MQLKSTLFIVPYLVLFLFMFTSCGGGLVPDYLKEARVDISTWTPKKEVVLKKDDLNLVKAIVPLKGTSEFLIVSDNQVIRLSNYKLNPDFKGGSHQMYNPSIISDTSGEPSFIVGNGLWGKPSAAVFDIDGKLMWSNDYGFDSQGRAAVLDDGDERFVVVKKKEEGLLFHSFESGEIVRKGSPNRIIASADFSGDDHYEVLVDLDDNDFAILNGKEHELYNLSVSDPYWYEPVVTLSTLPLVVLSAGNVLDVYDSKLKLLKNFDAEGAISPMHVVAATFIGEIISAPFAAVYKGRGGWHRSILFVFSSTGDLVYKEILEGDYQSITSVPQSDGIAFLLGGRNEVLLYTFQ